MATASKLTPPARVVTSTRLRDDSITALQQMGSERKHTLSGFMATILEGYAKGTITEAMATRQQCAALARQVMERKLKRAKDEKAPYVYSAGCESTALEIIEAILKESEVRP